MSTPKTPMTTTEGAALLSGDGAYRYRLTRTWDRTAPTSRWVMLNPSTADSLQDDPTIRRCMGFAKSWGYGGLEVWNLCALRATDPMDLLFHPDPVGPRNLIQIKEDLQHAPDVVVAWGNDGARWANAVLEMLRELGVHTLCLGVTQAGHPRHPLYLAAITPRMSFPVGGTRGAAPRR